MTLQNDKIEPLFDGRNATRESLWGRIQCEARVAIRDEPLLGALIHAGLLHHATFEAALAYRFSLKLSSREMSEQILREIADDAFARSPDLARAAREDLLAVYERDPATHRLMQPILFFKGYQALQAYRIGCGSRADLIWPISCRCAARRCSATIFTRPPGSARG